MEVLYITSLQFWLAIQSLQPCEDVLSTNCYWDRQTMDTAISYIVTEDGGMIIVGDPNKTVTDLED